METDPERPQTLTLPHFPSFFFLAGVKKETHYAERTLINRRVRISPESRRVYADMLNVRQHY